MDINNIHFNKLLAEIVKYSKPNAEDVILALAIPRVAESVYTIRSKKNVAHVKTVNPNFIDASYCVTACDWMLSEIALLLYSTDSTEVSELINSMLKKKVPAIEEFEDDSFVILRKDLNLSQEILLTLYHYYPKRLSSAYLSKSLKSTNVYTTLKKLESERLIQRNKDGNKLTTLGIAYIEDEVLKE